MRQHFDCTLYKMRHCNISHVQNAQLLQKIPILFLPILLVLHVSTREVRGTIRICVYALSLSFYAALYPMKRKIETKYRLPLLNWVTIPPTQVANTVFAHIDDEKILKALDLEDFEEVFKAKGQSESKLHGPVLSEPSIRRTIRESILQPNRSQNVAIARRKITCSMETLKQSIAT